MAIGIDPKVDYAFKLVFGNPKHTAVTVHFLNAVLSFPHPITSVEILNPIQDKDFDEDKLAVLDILARDSEGRQYNIEMQSTLPVALAQRLTYYNCQSYARQLKSGESFDQLKPTIGICVLNGMLFANAEGYHLSFRLRCDQDPQLVFNPDLELHLLELPKYRAAVNNVEGLGPLEQWLYFLKFADSLAPGDLANQLADDAFRQATGVLKMISESSDEREFYEARRRELDSMENWVAAARREAMKVGLEQGREQGREEGREEGIGLGLDQGALMGKVQMLQEILGEAESTKEELSKLDSAELNKLIAELQLRLRGRGDEA